MRDINEDLCVVGTAGCLNKDYSVKKLWKEYFSGRARRAEWWLVSLVLFPLKVLGILIVLGRFRSIGMGEPFILIVLNVMALILFLIGILIGIFVDLRRLHDMNMSGWWLLLLWILAGALSFWNPILEKLVWGVSNFLLGCIDGTPGPNRYGEDPKWRKGK